MYVCVCVRTHVCVRMCVCMRVCACVCVPLSRLKSKDNVSAHISDVTTTLMAFLTFVLQLLM